jgi:prepilin-type processing-associated H-X9-DG protein
MSIKYTTHLKGITPDNIVVMGEKADFQSNGNPVLDYYMDEGDFTRGIIEAYRHGTQLGSNYLFLDLHVGILNQKDAAANVDPWEITNPSDIAHE